MNDYNRRRSYSDRNRDDEDFRPHHSGSHGWAEEKPPHSRLFIIGGKTLTESDFETAFGQFGTVERVEVKRGKGITYVKFAKTSEAADAMEELNGKTIGDDPRPLKIVIASSKAQGNNRDDVDALRLFLVIPKSMTEEDMRNKFNSYGPVEWVSIIRDKRTNESKGLGYVKYFRFSHAARAFEGVGPEFKAKFAEPRPDKRSDGGSERSFGSGGGFRGNQGGFGGGYNDGFGGGGYGGEMPTNIRPTFESTIPNPTGTCRLAFMCNTILTQEKLWKLFDVIPGLECCELVNVDRNSERGYGTVIYNNPNSAAYAIEKLCGFDYPLGSRIMLKFDDSAPSRGGGNSGFAGANSTPNLPSDIKTLVNTIQHATQMLQQAGYGDYSNVQGDAPMVFEPSMFSGNLPPSQPKADPSAECAKRLFIVFKECRGDPPSQPILNEVFGRFGNLIEIYTLKGKRCGYARYSSSQSADSAMRSLNHQTLCGAFLKVMEAEESYSEKIKRQKLDPNPSDY